MGLFVTIEGIEGAGKSTIRAKIAEALISTGREIIVTREPGATNLGQALRTILLSNSETEIDPIAELLLFFADRAQHLKEVIRPALSRNAIVLCDRYIHSTIAYQGYGRGLPMKELLELTEFATAGVKPDLVLLLDLEVEEGLSRAEKRTRRASGTFHIDSAGQISSENMRKREIPADDSWNRFEQQQIDFHKRVRSGFLEMSKDKNNNFFVLQAIESPDKLASAAIEKITSLL